MHIERTIRNKKHWSKLCLYLGRCDDGEQVRNDYQGEVQALPEGGVQACDEHGGAGAGGAQDEDGLAQGGGVGRGDDVDGGGDGGLGRNVVDLQYTALT
jgi:hypothetical protein